MAPSLVHPASYGQVIEYIQGKDSDMKQNNAPLCDAHANMLLPQIAFT